MSVINCCPDIDPEGTCDAVEDIANKLAVADIANVFTCRPKDPAFPYVRLTLAEPNGAPPRPRAGGCVRFYTDLVVQVFARSRDQSSALSKQVNGMIYGMTGQTASEVYCVHRKGIIYTRCLDRSLFESRAALRIRISQQ